MGEHKKKKVKIIQVDDCCESSEIKEAFEECCKEEFQHKGKHHGHHKHKVIRRRHRKVKSTKMFTSKEDVVKYVDEHASEGVYVEVFKVDDDFYKVELSVKE